MRVLMIAPTFLVVQRQRFNNCANIVHRQQFCQIADRESGVGDRFRSSHSGGTGGRTLERVLNACFNDCANILGCVPSAVLSHSLLLTVQVG